MRLQIDALKDNVSKLGSSQASDVERLTHAVHGLVNDHKELELSVKEDRERMLVVKGALRVTLERLALVEEQLQHVAAEGVNASTGDAVDSKLPAMKKNALQVSIYNLIL